MTLKENQEYHEKICKIWKNQEKPKKPRDISWKIIAPRENLKVLKQPSQKFWPKIRTPYFFTVTFA